MTGRADILFYCQHLLGIGHLRRAALIAKALDVTGLAKDLVAKRMTPPATCYFRTGHGIGQVRYRSARTLEDHTVPSYKLDRLVGRHIRAHSCLLVSLSES